MSESKKTVLITGCSSGIGEDSAVFLASKGWTVFGTVRKEEDAAKLRQHDANIKPILMDVTKEADVNRAMEEVRAAVGADGLDALVNNSGVAFSGPLEFAPEQDVMRQFDVNVFGLIRVTQAAMPLIRMGKPGRIVNIGSCSSDQNTPFLPLYAGAKAAVASITEVFRREVARWGIKVVLIKPGPVKTNFDKTAMQRQQEFQSKFPAGSSCHDLYGKDLANMPKAAEAFSSHQVPVRKVTNRIYTALTARKPKNLYYDTWGSYFTVAMIHWVPLGIQDSLISSIFIVKD